MALADDSYLPKFFTEDRLKGYRKLHKRCRLWCGVWPPDEASLPEFRDWAPFMQVFVHGGRSGLGCRVFFDSEPNEGKLPRPFELNWEGEKPRFTDIDGPTGWLVAAINYVGWDWSTNQERAWKDEILEEWRERLSALLTPKELVLTIDALRPDHPETFDFADLLVDIRNLALWSARGSEERKELLDELESMWIHIGRWVGVLPVPRGNTGLPECSLPPAFLVELREELRSLLPDVIRYKPGTEDLVFVEAHGADDPELLLRQLAFPMLRAHEIERVIEETKGYVSTKTDSLSLDILAGRLPISRGTLKNQLSKAC